MTTLFLLTLLLAAPETASAEGFDTLVVCPPPYLAEMRPWFEHRQQQGHRIGVITETSSKTELKAAIRKGAEAGTLQYVLLVGDAVADESTEIGVPPHYQEAVVNVLFGSEPEIPTDNYYADLNDDGIPELAVGRFSVRNAAQLRTLVTKTLAYETAIDAGDWQRRLHFVAGLGGFGTVVDTMMESVTKKFLTDEIPPHFETVVAQGSWQSPYCPDPREFRDEVVRQLNSGGLFWVYMGHGHVESLDYIRVPDQEYPILTTQDVPALRNQHTSPIAIFLSCYTGAFDAPRDCLGEQLHRERGGPVAVFAGSRVTMPYAMSVLGTEMLQQYFHERQPTLGQLILHSKRESIRQGGKSGNRKMLDTMARLVSPKPKLLREERLEHLALFNLLGDPLLRLPHAAEVEVTAPETARPGDMIEIAGATSIPGKVRIELVCRRDGCVAEVSKRTAFSSGHEDLSKYNAVYQAANDRVWHSFELGPTENQFSAKFQVPAVCQGPCHVRVIVEGAEQIALGSQNLLVRVPNEVAEVAASSDR